MVPQPAGIGTSITGTSASRTYRHKTGTLTIDHMTVVKLAGC